MQSKIGAGIVAGLIAGVMFGIMMQMMTAPAPMGGRLSMMAMVAMIVHSHSVAIGWLYHLFNSGVIGALFGWLLGARAHRYGRAIQWGALYGMAWWIAGGLILMPMLLGTPVFAPFRMPMMHTVAWGSLMGHVIFGVILGASFVWLRRASIAVEGARAV